MALNIKKDLETGPFLCYRVKVNLCLRVVPPLRLERRSLPPEGNALSTELWGLAPEFYHERQGLKIYLRHCPFFTSDFAMPADGQCYGLSG